MAGYGALIAVLDYEGVSANEFNDWYDTEHIPERLRVPGVLSAQRWLSADGKPLSVVTYDLETLGVLASPPYRAIAGQNFSAWSKRVIGSSKKFWRYEAEQILPGKQVSPENAEGLLLVAANVDAAAEKDFNDWYDTEHVPALLKVPGVVAARRYRSVVGEHRYIAIYHLASPTVVESGAWRDAVETPWTQRIRPQMRDVLRIVCKKYVRTQRTW